MSTENATETDNAETAKPTAFERLGESLYWKGGKIVARVRVNGKPTWRSTGTDNPAEARKWLKKWRSEEWMEEHGFEAKGVILHRKQVTVSKVIEDYLAAGCPARKGHSKAPATIQREKCFLSPVRAYFGDKIAASVTLGDCDKYRDWRLSGGYISTYKMHGGHPRTIRTSGGKRTVDIELMVLSNAFALALRRNVLTSNPLHGRGRYTVASEVRHCREVAPTPEGLKQIENWLRLRSESAIADVVCFLAFSGLRIGEALPLTWGAVNWPEMLLHVTREKKGIVPFVPILPEMEALLKDMKKRATGDLLFPSPFDPNKPRDVSAIRHRIKAACKKLEIGHVTPHGCRSYFVTQARQSGLTDAEIASLIGDKSGPAIIASTYGDLRPDHLLAQAQRIRLTVGASTSAGEPSGNGSIKRSIESQPVSARPHEAQEGAQTVQAAPSQTL